MKLHYPLLLVAATLLAACSNPLHQASNAVPQGVRFKEDTIERKGNFGDNWCQTWAADGHIYTMLDDGNGWWGDSHKTTDHAGWWGSMCLQITGGPGFGAGDVHAVDGWPDNPANSPLYAYGIVSVEGTLYVWLWKTDRPVWYGRPEANRLLYSRDSGETFYRWNGEKETEETFLDFSPNSFFFYREDPRPKEGKDAWAFNWIAICQSGQDNSAAKDDYIYMYSPEQYNPQHLSMIRVHKDHILDREHYEYFQRWDGDKPVWTKKLAERGPNLVYPDPAEGQSWSWASWFPDVVYNPGLDLYVMVSYGIIDPGKNYWANWCSKCEYPASLGFWYSKTPYGPWTQFHYTEFFYSDREKNRTYGFKLSPKWISEDGRTMHLIWSDAGDDHTTNYKWNQMEVELLLE